MGHRAESVRVARSLFQGTGGGSTPTSALCLELVAVEFRDAKAMNRLWHSRLPRLGTGAIDNQPFPCFAAAFGGLFYAVAIWSPPVARLLPQDWSWLELRRLAVAPDAPRNTPSRMLGVMTRLMRKNRPDAVRLISYQDTEVHTGTIYAAAGWKRAKATGGQTRWDMPGRNRPKAQSDAPKRRWDRCLVCAMGPDRESMCEVCRERITDERADPAAPDTAQVPGAVPGLPLPGRGEGRTP